MPAIQKTIFIREAKFIESNVKAVRSNYSREGGSEPKLIYIFLQANKKVQGSTSAIWSGSTTKLRTNPEKIN